MKRTGVTYVLHHIGIPTAVVRPGERYSAQVGMFTSDDWSGPLPLQWHRFTPASSLHPLIKSEAHLAYKVSSLAAALAGHTVILGPYEPIDGFRVAMIDHDGVPIELIETSLTDAVIWDRAVSGEKASLYD